MNQRGLFSVAVIPAVAMVLGAMPAHAQTKGFGVKRSPTFLGPTNVTLVDLNTASKDDLIKLLGLDEVEAQAAINGTPYKLKSDLLNRAILPAAVYAKIKSKVFVTEQ
jgi:DNA uptake protein ComE-like DNA-binding protein